MKNFILALSLFIITTTTTAAEINFLENPVWKTVLEKTAAMLVDMGIDNPLKLEHYTTIQHQALFMLGDRDKMVTLDETVEVYKNLPKAHLAVLPNTAHPIEMVNSYRLANEIKAFLT